MSHRNMLFSLIFAASGIAVSQAALAEENAPSVTAQAHSPILATADQIALEKRVLRILSSTVMKEEIQRVEALYAADAQGRTATGKATIRRAAHSIAVAAAQYAVQENTDKPAAFWSVNAPHRWAGIHVPRSGYGIDNPDNVYRNIMLDGAARYEIRGRVTSPGPAEQQYELRDSIPGTGGMAAEGGQQLATLRSNQMIISPDGMFTITADSDPANGRANHLQIPAQGKYLLIVRDLFTDWATQHPIALDVRRLSGPPAGQPRSDVDVAQRTAALLGQIAPYWLNYDNQYIYTKGVNELGTARSRPGGRGLSTSGHFQLHPDEAWVITVNPLEAVSLGVQLTDPWGVAYEYVTRTSSLNNAQARANADGSYTFVVSQRDPGVYNWLDPEGHAAGMIAIRWQSVPDGQKPDQAIGSARVVPMAQLRNALPAETSFISPAARAAQQAERAIHYALRLGQ